MSVWQISSTWIFALVMQGVLTLAVSWMGGWHHLAVMYRQPHRALIQQRQQRRVSGRVGSIIYQNSLSIAIDTEGLSLSIGTFLLKTGHPPLLIPWYAIQSVTHQVGTPERITQLWVQPGQLAEPISIILPTAILEPALPHLPNAQEGPIHPPFCWKNYLLFPVFLAIGVFWIWFAFFSGVIP